MPEQLSFFDTQTEIQPDALTTKEKEVLSELLETEVLNMTPLAALQYLFELKEKLRTKKG